MHDASIGSTNLVSSPVSTASAFDVTELSPAHLDGFRALFEAASSPCYCRYWHFEGTKNDWLERCAFRPEENFQEHAEAVRRGDPSSRGLVAIERSSSLLVGWMKLTLRSHLPKLRRLPVYRALDLGPEDSVLSVGCLLVHPEKRHRGVARALIESAEIYGRSWGAAAVEGYPRRSTEPLHDEEAWQGPERLFLELGFEVLSDVAPYPVYRKRLRM